MTISAPSPSQHGLPFNETRGGSSRSMKPAGRFNNGQRIDGAVAPQVPRRHQSPARGAMRAASLLELPPGESRGGFSPRCGMGVGPFLSALLYLSGHPARPPRPMPGATTEAPPNGGLFRCYPRTAAPLNGANQTEGAAA